MAALNGGSGAEVYGKRKLVTKFKHEWLRELVETELPTSSGVQVAKLGDIFQYRHDSGDVVCQICRQAGALTNFSNGKRWDDWKMDYLKRHLHHKIHLASVAQLKQQIESDVERILNDDIDSSCHAADEKLVLNNKKRSYTGLLTCDQLQECFTALMSRADTQHVHSFFLWLDIRVSLYKIFGEFISGSNFDEVKLKLLSNRNGSIFNGKFSNQFSQDKIHGDSEQTHSGNHKLLYPVSVSTNNILESSDDLSASRDNVSFDAESFIDSLLDQNRSSDSLNNSTSQSCEFASGADVMNSENESFNTTPANENYIEIIPQNNNEETETMASGHLDFQSSTMVSEDRSCDNRDIYSELHCVDGSVEKWSNDAELNEDDDDLNDDDDEEADSSGKFFYDQLDKLLVSNHIKNLRNNQDSDQSCIDAEVSDNTELNLPVSVVNADMFDIDNYSGSRRNMANFIRSTIPIMCSESFSKKSNGHLQNTMYETEDGSLKYICPHCHKRFHRSSNFSRHMRIHRGVYSYMCGVCKRGFYRREHFNKHSCQRKSRASPTRGASSGKNCLINDG